ncbi:hypothetical protein [Flavobacterium johnsoniae]|uniref:Uncharacterized protein n=1 Tax=Flavobacterium johnsoniae (strain ATCC 17061 / DSM 2064 / JCM 8514 / BCRC 14874 / CCUG 350202 / NBRC 14942 / NCIMB 11054 / UW101) TaxID=376686 RepID=A5FKT6_FLAJ1|nr:hypothetical protein [Flavobacterium johnsoniae]ABQ04186.1 hypothetical protein Fjoh_1153 [Flavobacterium johnsoniae UW101]OXG02580.1 hypothetical protein B0A63_02700 [Flavobacterium johnsoniae UW101]WQG84019.1 hypothetical protein SR927_13030 [Flavobacterium johnsoniae UW101]SHK14940.1 hypothetical protein SAMN05444146_0569 [Flavobacterium johnsoniae]
MSHLRFRQLLVISNSAKSANQFQFERLNLITADDNSVGKSTLAKLLFWGLGCEPEFDTTWATFDCSTIIMFSIENREYEIKRYKNSISLKEQNTIVHFPKITGDFSVKLAEIVGFKALLPNQKTGELETPPPAYYFLPFYIDQKRSWSRAWDNFNNLGQYRSWKKTIIKYHVGLLTSDYFELEIEKAIKKNNKIILNSEVDKINSTLEIVESYLPPATIATFVKNDFDDITVEIEKDLEELSIQQENVFDKYSTLQITKSHLEHQKLIAENLIQELDKDYVFAVENIPENHLKCPLCGTNYENSIENKTAILTDKSQAEDQLDNINYDLIITNRKLANTSNELNQIREKIDNLSDKYLKKEDNEHFTFSNLIESIGGHSIKKNVSESRDSKLGSIQDLDRDIRLATKSQKNLYKQDYIDDINGDFHSFLSSHIKSLDAQAVNLSQVISPLSYSKIISEGGAAENSRAILAYYIAIFSLVEKYKNEVVSPLVIDTPNQQEQSENNYSNIVSLILNKISKNNQVIICAMTNPQLAPLAQIAHIIKLDNSKLLDPKKYIDIKKIFDSWE